MTALAPETGVAGPSGRTSWHNELGVFIIGFDFSTRAKLPDFREHMDEPCSYEDLRACLRDIARVNQLTLAYRPTLDWLESLRKIAPLGQPIHIVDVGCGYGDALRRIVRWAIKRNFPVRLTGIDLNLDAIRAAREATDPRAGITFVAGDTYTWQPPEPIDVVISSLLTHHLEDREIVEFLVWMERTARLGWFINDLHRERVPYELFRLMARLTNWHPFVKHDGPVSILRSFRPADWERLCAAAVIPPETYTLGAYRPARLCVSRVVLPTAETKNSRADHREDRSR